MSNKQNYFFRILLILIIVPSMWWYFSTKRKYREMNTVPHIKMEMKEFLKKRYNEDFDIITVPYIYDDYCEAVITPKRYKGTAKEYDLFYKTEVYMALEKIPIINEYKHVIVASNYDSILLKENLEKDLKPKLEKWFGKNVLVALQLEGACYYDDYKKEIQHRREENEDETLSGGIYIFGRVENEKDREKYRKGIYEFIQYLKQEGMFEYVDLTIYVMDERYLSKEFDELGLQDKLLDNYDAYVKTRRPDLKRTPEEVKAFIERKKKIYSEIGENYTIDPNKINEIPRYQVIQHDQNLISGILYLSRIVSEKSIKTNYFLKDRKIKQYDKLEDVDL